MRSVGEAPKTCREGRRDARNWMCKRFRLFVAHRARIADSFLRPCHRYEHITCCRLVFWLTCVREMENGKEENAKRIKWKKNKSRRNCESFLNEKIFDSIVDRMGPVVCTQHQTFCIHNAATAVAPVAAATLNGFRYLAFPLWVIVYIVRLFLGGRMSVCVCVCV